MLAGTQISDALLDIATAGLQTVKGFATIDNVALINVEVSVLLFCALALCSDLLFLLVQRLWLESDQLPSTLSG